MTHRDDGGIRDCQTDTSNVSDCGGKVSQERISFDIENGGGENITRVIDLEDNHSVGEGGDVQHVEEGCFRGTDFETLVNEMDFIDDFNGTTGNLGGNTEG